MADPPPVWERGAASDWFTRFRDKWLLGLLGLDLMIVIGLVLSVPVYLALYDALRRTAESAMALAMALAWIGADVLGALNTIRLAAGIVAAQVAVFGHAGLVVRSIT